MSRGIHKHSTRMHKDSQTGQALYYDYYYITWISNPLYFENSGFGAGTNQRTLESECHPNMSQIQTVGCTFKMIIHLFWAVVYTNNNLQLLDQLHKICI